MSLTAFGSAILTLACVTGPLIGCTHERRAESTPPAAPRDALTPRTADPTDAPPRPNVLLIYTDDIGFGDLSVNGGVIPTPHMDALAASGINFTNAHCAASTCTPSRYALLTGQYPLRNPNAVILDGDAPMAIAPDTFTFPDLFKQAGYTTGVIGKWHLGLGDGNTDWNGSVSPNPTDRGFDVSNTMGATNDRGPTVSLAADRVDGLDPDDPISVDYRRDPGALPTGRDRPDLLIYPADGQHSGTIIRGISRIGYMAGGEAAWWDDALMAQAFTDRAIDFIQSHQDVPWMLHVNLAQIHTPRLPHPDFRGQSGHGVRGDALLETDHAVGRLVHELAQLGLTQDTIVVFSSDNGPVVIDGYFDASLDKLGDHDPNGPYRGGKYLPWEAGTRVPTILAWPGQVTPGTSAALVSQVDLAVSLGALVGATVPEPTPTQTQTGTALPPMPDAQNQLDAWLGRDPVGRTELVQQAAGRSLSLRMGRWKYIAPGPRVTWPDARHNLPDSPLASEPVAEHGYLFDLGQDPAETTNVINEHPQRAAAMQARLDAIINAYPAVAR